MSKLRKQIPSGRPTLSITRTPPRVAATKRRASPAAGVEPEYLELRGRDLGEPPAEGEMRLTRRKWRTALGEAANNRPDKV